MNCPDVQRQLADYSAGLVQGEARQRLQEHIGACDACRERLQELRTLDRLMAADRVEADEALVRGVMARVRAAEIPRARYWLYLLEGAAPIVAAASLVPVAILLLYKLAGQWVETAPAWDLDLSALSEPQSVAVVLGMVAVVGAVSWVSQRLAEALT